MYSLKDTIWELFGPMESLNDTYKVEGKGIRQRYNQIIGEDFDENILPFVTNMIENTLVPQTALLKFLPYLEDMLGGRAVITNDIATRRRILRFMIRFRQVHGTERGYKLVFNTIGIQCSLVEYFVYYGFDSIVTFDNPIRRFDMGKCQQFCTEYTLVLSGHGPLTDELEQFIKNAIALNEPINAVLREFVYNDLDSGSNSDFVSVNHYANDYVKSFYVN